MVTRSQEECLGKGELDVQCGWGPVCKEPMDRTLAWGLDLMWEVSEREQSAQSQWWCPQRSHELGSRASSVITGGVTLGKSSSLCQAHVPPLKDKRL